MNTKKFIQLLVVTFAILSIPFLVMQFTNQVAWGAFDFAIAGTLIFLAGLAIISLKNNYTSKRLVSYFLFSLFFLIGILNLFIVDIVPAIIYLLFSTIFLPSIDKVMKNKLNFTIPFVVKIILAFLAIWGTLAVGDLAEILGL